MPVDGPGWDDTVHLQARRPNFTLVTSLHASALSAIMRFMRKQGKFLLFDNAGEFAAWLTPTTVNRRIGLVQQHHTFIPNYATFKGNNHFALLVAMENAHIERGFAEIAQNLTTYPDGAIAVCRSLDKIPAGIKGANTPGICIENIGNFDAGGDAMNAIQRQCILDLTAILCHKFALTPSTDSIVYHHWYDLNTGVRTNGTGVTKTCPRNGLLRRQPRRGRRRQLRPAGRRRSRGLAHRRTGADSRGHRGLYRHRLLAQRARSPVGNGKGGQDALPRHPRGGVRGQRRLAAHTSHRAALGEQSFPRPPPLRGPGFPAECP